MIITWKHWIMPFVPTAVGILLIYLGFAHGWGRVWAAGGVFFITVGVSAMLLNLGWTLPGPVGNFLRHPVSNILIFLAILITMLITIVIGLVDTIIR